MDGKPVAEQDIGRQLLQETETYAESSVCRRKLLLHYFGETILKIIVVCATIVYTRKRK